MKKALVAGVLLLAGMIYAWRDSEPVQPPAPTPTPAYTIPTPEPLEPIKPPGYDDPTQPAPTLPAAPHWGRCSGFRGLQAVEDANLRLVLASTVEDDELFGLREIQLEAASCSAARERIAWMGR